MSKTPICIKQHLGLSRNKTVKKISIIVASQFVFKSSNLEVYL